MVYFRQTLKTIHASHDFTFFFIFRHCFPRILRQLFFTYSGKNSHFQSTPLLSNLAGSSKCTIPSQNQRKKKKRKIFSSRSSSSERTVVGRRISSGWCTHRSPPPPPPPPPPSSPFLFHATNPLPRSPVACMRGGGGGTGRNFQRRGCRVWDSKTFKRASGENHADFF